MDAKEIRIKRKKLETEITELCLKFEEETQIFISDLQVERS
jgi:hypothetical protein